MRYSFAGVLLTGVSIIAVAQEPSFTPPPNVPRQSAWIPVRQQLQELNLCGPTSASMILDYFGISISPGEIKTLSRSKTYQPDTQFTDFTGMTDLELLKAVRRLGFNWKLKNYPMNEGGFERGIWDIERSLDKGIPVLIETSLYAGYFYVVSGYSAANRTIIVAILRLRSLVFVRCVWLTSSGYGEIAKTRMLCG